MTHTVTRARLVGRPGEANAIAHEFDEQAIVGRAPDNDVFLGHPFLSSRHARIYRQGDAYWIEDLGSRNGTRLDGVTVTRPARLDRLHVITLADTVDFVFIRDSDSGDAIPQPAAARADRARPDAEATTELTRFDLDFDTLIDPRGAADVAAAMAGRAEQPPLRYALVIIHATGRQEERPLNDGDNVLGRGDDCDIVLPDPERWLGRHHATLRIAPDAVQLVDHQSMNGTFIDGRRVETAVLVPGLTFRLGPYLELTLVRQ